MNKPNLVENLSRKIPNLSESKVKDSVDCILNIITEALEVNKRVEVRNFGSFNMTFRKERTVRNPMIGGDFKWQARYTPTFKAGKNLKDRANKKTNN